MSAVPEKGRNVMDEREFWENEHQMEVENRVRNLMWTVSGD